MAMTLAVTKRKQAGGALIAYVSITNSGNYPTGGDAVDFAVAVGGVTNRKPDLAIIEGIAGYIYQWDRANDKILVRGSAAAAGAALAEFTSGAYSAALTADTVIARLEWVAIPGLT